MMWPFFDPTMIFLIPAMIFVFYAQSKVKSTFAQWSRVGNAQGLTGAEVARRILDAAGLQDVPVEYVEGELTDHYDPRAKAIRLSSSTYRSTSIGALGVAAHEVGHAIQHQESYVPLSMRNMIWPVARIGDMFGPLLVILGVIFAGPVGTTMMEIGILVFTLAVGFYVVTLPVEFNASSRAIAILEGDGYLNREEIKGARKVLNAAALTYVAAAAVAISQLIRLLIIRNSRD